MKTYPLGNEAVRYIRECLADGLGLSKCLLETVDLDAGQVATFFPEYVDARTLKDFRAGGKLKYSGPVWYETDKNGHRTRIQKAITCHDYLVEHLRKDLSDHPGHIAIFEDYNSEDTAAVVAEWTKCSNCKLLVLDNHVHPLLDAQDNAASIRAVISSADATWHFVGAISQKPSVLPLNGKYSKISESDMKEICADVKALMIGAYDSESFLLWTPHSDHCP